MKNKSYSPSLMIDSGAFSARRVKENATKDVFSFDETYLDEYIEFCKRNLNNVDYFVNLDVIPLDPHGDIIKKQAIESAKKGWDNYWYMVNNGVPKEKLIHVFHRDEPFEYLKEMVNTMPYIGLSPGRKRAIPQKVKWLDTCMKYVCDTNGFPKVKFHGFAVTSIRLMKRYPWYSVDSTSWTSFSRLGLILMPKLINGKWSYMDGPIEIGVTIRAPKSNYDYHSPQIKSLFDKYLNDTGYKIGKSHLKEVGPDYKLKDNELWLKRPEIVEVIEELGLKNSHALRDELNALYYINLEKEFPEWPWSFKRSGKKRRFF